MRKDPLPDLRMVRANWLALSVFGHDQHRGPSGASINGVSLSARSFALLFADAEWLMTLFDPN